MNSKPQIRFKGFDADWEQRKLKEIVDISTGFPFESKKFDNKGEYLVITNGNIQNDSDKVDHSIGNRINIDGDIKLKKYILDINDILVTMDGDVGRVAKVANNKEILAQRVARLTSKDNYEFLYQLLNNGKFISQMTMIAHGGTIKHISLTDIEEFETYVGQNNQEIHKIGTFLGNIDTLINLNQRKCDSLENIKKAMLEKMFPKNNSKIPEVRFKKFNDEWEQYKLCEMGNSFTGLFGKTKEDFGHGQARYVPYMNVFKNPITDKDMLEQIEIDSSQNEVKYGDVFFTTSSETPEEVGMSSVWLGNNENVYLNSFCFGYRPNVEINPYYLGYLLRTQNMRNKITFLAQGISRFNISKTQLLESYIPITSLEEQKLIGEYFSKLDSLITLHQQKLEKLKKIKKFLLEKMFV